MRQTAEIRFSEEWARDNLGSRGKRLSELTRRLRLEMSDPLFEELKDKLRSYQGKNPAYSAAWFERTYTAAELENGELFRMIISRMFEPAGEECGTLYDESMACSHCGAGRRQVSDLVLDLRKVPKNKDVARSLADEWIVSQRVAELLVASGMSGFELRRVHHSARFQEDPIDPTQYREGRTLLRKAEAEHAPYPTWKFWVWLRRAAQQDLLDRLTQEHVLACTEAQRRRPSLAVPIWYQLVVTSRRVRLAPPTHFGISALEDDEKGRYRCPLGHVAGLNVLSEVWVRRDDLSSDDILCSEDMVGTRQGLLVPSPLVLMSPRLRRILKENNIKGYTVEIAHLT